MAARQADPNVHEIAMNIAGGIMSSEGAMKTSMKNARGTKDTVYTYVAKQSYLLAEALIKEGANH